MFDKKGSPKSSGDAAEALLLQHLQQQGLRLLERNYRVAAGPGSGRAGEVALILRDCDGTPVFFEVRAGTGFSHGGAAAGITPARQRHLIRAARRYLMRFASPRPAVSMSWRWTARLSSGCKRPSMQGKP